MKISNQQKFAQINKNLQTLQAFKGPLVKTFETLICGNPTITEDQDAEFCYIAPIEDKYSNERKGLKADVEKFLNETEASEDNISEAFYKLAGLLDKYEFKQKKKLMLTLEKN